MPLFFARRYKRLEIYAHNVSKNTYIETLRFSFTSLLIITRKFGRLSFGSVNGKFGLFLVHDSLINKKKVKSIKQNFHRLQATECNQRFF